MPADSEQWGSRIEDIGDSDDMDKRCKKSTSLSSWPAEENKIMWLGIRHGIPIHVPGPFGLDPAKGGKGIR